MAPIVISWQKGLQNFSVFIAKKITFVAQRKAILDMDKIENILCNIKMPRIGNDV